MKNIISATLISFLFLGSVFSQDNPIFKNALRINPVDFARSEFQLSYELMHNNKKNSIVLMPSIILRENPDNSTKGYQAMAQYRFYLTHFNKEDRHTFLNVYNYGFYAGVYSLYLDFEEEFTEGLYDPTTGEYENKRYNRNVNSFEGGALLGIRIDITRRIILDFNLGGGIRKSDVEDTYREVQEYVVDYSVFDRGYTGVKPKSVLSLGITF